MLCTARVAVPSTSLADTFFTTAWGGKSTIPSMPPVLAELQRLGATGQRHRPGLAVFQPRQRQLDLALELGRVLHRLQHQHLPLELALTHHLGLQAADGNTVLPRGRNQLFKKAQVVAQRAIVGLQHTDLRGHFFLRGALGCQQAA
jgi:hypothetical protein